MRKILSFFVATIVLLNCCIGIQAAVPEVLVPLWDNISTLENEITFEGMDGIAVASLTGKSGTTEITGTLKVYKETDRGWVFVTSDSDSVTGRVFRLNVEFTGVAGGYYKSVFSVTVTRNGVEETETDTYYANC